MTKARIWIALAVLAAFLAGSLFVGYIAPRFSNTQATLPAQTQVAAREPAPQPLLLSAGPAANPSGPARSCQVSQYQVSFCLRWRAAVCRSGLRG